MSGGHDPVWLLARIAFAVATSSIVVVGSLSTSISPRLEEPVRVLGVALGLTRFELVLGAACLLPSLVFLLGVRTPWRILLFGALLLGITAAAWTWYAVSRREALAGLAIVAGAFWSLVSSSLGATLEADDRHRPGLSSRGVRQGEVAAPPPRAWGPPREL